MTPLEQTVADLVEIRSVIPEETELADYVQARLEMGPHPVHRVNDTLVVGKSEPGALLLVGHLDTVPPSADNPLRATADRIYGLGAADMKGGLAVMIHLLEDNELAQATPHLVGIFYEGEEGGRSGNSLVPTMTEYEWLQAARFGLVLEPSDNQIELGCNGSLSADVYFEGRAGHSARPWQGLNAITKSAAWLDRVNRRFPVPVVVGGITFREVFVVTEAQGGVAKNIVPPAMKYNLNYRFAPHRNREQAWEQLQSLCPEADRVELIDYSPPGLLSSDHPWSRLLCEITGSVPVGKQGWTDLATLTEAGIPALNYGPGNIAQAHQAVEWLEWSSLHMAWRNLSEFVRRAQGTN